MAGGPAGMKCQGPSDGERIFTMALRSISWTAVAAAIMLGLGPSPASAGVVDGVKTVDDLTIYLGVVPAAIVRGHKAELAAAVRGGLPRSSLHNIHLVAAIFDKTSGARVRHVRVRARIHGSNRNRWTLPLNPMPVDGAMSFGGYTNLGAEEDLMISIDVIRPGRQRATTAVFDYRHD